MRGVIFTLSTFLLGCLGSYPLTKIDPSIREPVHLDPEYGWVNNAGKCLAHVQCTPLRSITLRAVNRTQSHVPVTIKCTFEDGSPFGEEVELNLEPRAGRLFLVYGMSRGLGVGEDIVSCKLTRK